MAGNSSGKFSTLDINSIEVKKMTPDLADSLGGGFRCRRPEFVTFWKRGRIVREEIASISRCWVVHFEGSLLGYITLLADKLTMEECLLDGEGVQYQTFPAVKIGLLATELRCRGVGTLLVMWALEYTALHLTERVGVRFVTVDAFYDADSGYDAAPFYEKLGFRFANPDAEWPPRASYRTMYFDIGSLAPASGYRLSDPGDKVIG